MNFYIPVEVKSRELYSRILIAKYAAERGFNVYLGRKGELNDGMAAMPPGIYYGMGTVRNFAPFYRSVAGRGNRIAVNDEEGLVTFSDDMYLDLKVASETLASIDLLFAWGEENFRVLSKGRPDAASKLRITGNPRFDLLKDPFRRVYDGEIAGIRRRYPRFVLVCTSFASCNHYIAGLDYVQSLIEKKVLTGPASVAVYRRYQQMKRTAWEAFMKAVPMLARAYPDIDFVVRTHPSENPEPFREWEGAHRNVHLENRLSIHPWILAAEALVHHYDTSAVEAFAAGTPGFALRPERDASIEKEIPYECSTECKSPEDLLESLKPVLVSGAGGRRGALKSRKDYIPYVWNIGDSIASERILEEISRLTEGRVPGGDSSRWVGGRSALAGRLRGAVAPFLPWGRAGRRYVAHKFDRLSAAEVEKVLDVFAPGNRRGFRCEGVGYNLVRIAYDGEGRS
jgi:surface carbohydrate biosynthesis protein